MIQEKINVAELLKDCPKGMEFDCLLCNSPIALEGVGGDESAYPIRAVGKDGFHHVLTKYGALYNHADAKCVIFPKGKTSWEGFVPPYKFKIKKNKWYVCIKDLLDNYTNKAFRKGDIYYSSEDEHLIPSNSNVPSKVEYCTDEYFRDWTIQDAKDGDVLVDKYNNIGIFQEYVDIYWHSYIYLGSNGRLLGFNIGGSHGQINTHLAMEEEKQKLFNAIKENGYKWNAKNKTLEKLIVPKFKVGDRIILKHFGNKSRVINAILDNNYNLFGGGEISFSDQDNWELVFNKFDITTLKPFESKVLVRDEDYSLWKPAIFGCNYIGISYPIMVIGGNVYRQCIPYEDNEHLLGTTNNCNEFYKTWE